MKCWCFVPLLIALSLAAQAEIRTEKVDYTHGETALQGYLAYDDAVASPRPGVLVVHEWWGLNDYAKSRARQLAELGYVALAVDMYGVGVVTKDPSQAAKLSGTFKQNTSLARARLQTWLEVLKKDERSDPQRIAAIGYCFGGTCVLELARDGADLEGVVSFHGGLGTPERADPNQIKARVLVCHGADDPHVAPEEVAAFQEEMRKAGADWQMVHYGGAVHSFTNPKSGGMDGVGYNANADRRSWEAMKMFFDELFAK